MDIRVLLYVEYTELPVAANHRHQSLLLRRNPAKPVLRVAFGAPPFAEGTSCLDARKKFKIVPLPTTPLTSQCLAFYTRFDHF